MSNQGDRQGPTGALPTETSASGAKDDAKVRGLKARTEAIRANLAASTSRHERLNPKRKAMAKHCQKFGWTEEEFEENWKLRSVYVGGMPSPNGKTLWDRLIDKLNKQLKANPRKNADLSGMSDAEKAARKKQQDATGYLRRKKEKAEGKPPEPHWSETVTDPEMAFLLTSLEALDKK